MERNSQQHVNRVSSGIAGFDQNIGGLPGNIFNVVETPDHQTGLLMLGHFLKAGLQNGERCTLVTLQDPLSLFQSLAECNFEFYEYLKSEQLAYLSYQPSVNTEIGLTNDYGGLIAEMERLSGDFPERVAFHQVDSLLNLHSHMLINNCIQKLAAAASNSSSTFLGQYVQFNNRIYRDVRVAFMKNMSGFLTLKAQSRAGDQPLLKLTLDRAPWFRTQAEELWLKLEPGQGLVQTSQEVTHPRIRKAG
jgi:hypothetical protein